MRASSRRANSRRAACGPGCAPARRTVNASASPTRPTFIGRGSAPPPDSSSGCSVRKPERDRLPVAGAPLERLPLIHELHGGQHNDARDPGRRRAAVAGATAVPPTAGAADGDRGQASAARAGHGVGRDRPLAQVGGRHRREGRAALRARHGQGHPGGRGRRSTASSRRSSSPRARSRSGRPSP